MRDFTRSLGAVLLLIVSAAFCSARDYRVTIAAAAQDRAGQVASVFLPREAAGLNALRDAAGNLVPLTVDAGGVARFVIPRQKAGETLRYALVAEDPRVAAPEAIVANQTATALTLEQGGRAIVSYRTDKDALPRRDIDPKLRRAGYFHPLSSPAGYAVSADYPANHAHHHGIWMAWSKTSFQQRAPNFWEMGEGSGRVEIEAIERAWSGPVHGGFVARHRWVDLSAPAPVAVAHETWTATVHAVEGGDRRVHVIDLELTQTAASDDPLVLVKNLYGGLGFRGRDEWNGKANLLVLTSEGATTRQAANSSRVRWCYLGGQVAADAIAGVAILGHPANPRAPQPIRVHPEMPFVCFAPTQLGDLIVSAVEPYRAAYRVLVFDGLPDRSLIEAFWQGFGSAAVATCEATAIVAP